MLFLTVWLIAQTALRLHHTPGISSSSHQSVGIPISSFVSQSPSLALCTNDGYLRNAYRLHKLDIPPHSSTLVKLMLLLIGGDIELNPGPLEWPAKSDFVGFFSMWNL